jgi:hypothetical protein
MFAAVGHVPQKARVASGNQSARRLACLCMSAVPQTVRDLPPPSINGREDVGANDRRFLFAEVRNAATRGPHIGGRAVHSAG